MLLHTILIHDGLKNEGQVFWEKPLSTELH